MGRFRRLGAKDYLVLIVALLVTAAFVLSAVSASRNRQIDAAKSAYQNCAQIEVVKSEIYATIEQSIGNLNHIGYYRTHPAEKLAAIKQATESLVRFAPRDCRNLPILSER